MNQSMNFSFFHSKNAAPDLTAETRVEEIRNVNSRYVEGNWDLKSCRIQKTAFYSIDDKMGSFCPRAYYVEYSLTLFPNRFDPPPIDSL